MKEKEGCFLKVKNDYLNFLKKEEIFEKSEKSKIRNLKNYYIPMAFWIEEKYKNKDKTLFLGLSGGQGSRKTTVSKILKIIMKKYFNRNIYVSSIDDFYKTLREREKMSKKIHRLFKTRGVPGTHDVKLIKKFFHDVKGKKFRKSKIPKFDKSIDDRLKSKFFYKIKTRPEIIILEGWCVGAKPQINSLIKEPLNILEKNEDQNFIWRKYVNEKLKKEYKKIFSFIDHLIFMKIPSFNMVLRWRLLQESKLRKKFKTDKKIMNYKEIKRFIMFYQRITLQMLKDLSKSASVVLLLKKNHEIKKIIFKSQ